MDTREVYRGAKSDYYTHCHDLPPQIGGCRVGSAGVPFKDEIDGKDGETGSDETRVSDVTWPCCGVRGTLSTSPSWLGTPNRSEFLMNY